MNMLVNIRTNVEWPHDKTVLVGVDNGYRHLLDPKVICTVPDDVLARRYATIAFITLGAAGNSVRWTQEAIAYLHPK